MKCRWFRLGIGKISLWTKTIIVRPTNETPTHIRDQLAQQQFDPSYSRPQTNPPVDSAVERGDAKMDVPVAPATGTGGEDKVSPSSSSSVISSKRWITMLSRKKQENVVPWRRGRFGLINGETSAFARSTTSIKLTWVFEQKEWDSQSLSDVPRLPRQVSR
jgi:hypothetical protein